MSRFEWTRYAGEDIEHAIGVMLSLRHPRSYKVRPSQGDKGQDKVVLTETGKDVYQIKRFATNLNGSQKRQCSESYERLLASHLREEVTVQNWYLTMPLDPTPQNVKWFDELTNNAPFNCEWRGLDFCEGLVAEFPKVIDYYFDDGRDRLETAIAQLSGLLGIRTASATNGGSKTLQAGDIHDDLAAVYASLNQFDPHYRYEFHVGESFDVPDHADLVFATQIRVSANQPVVTTMVFERYMEATADSPIPLSITVDITDQEVRQAIEDFRRFGTPVELPEGTLDFDGQLPGGLGGAFKGAAGSFGPARVGDEERTTSPYRLRIFDESNRHIVTARIAVTDRTNGVGGAGVRLVGAHEDDVFHVELLLDYEEKTFSIRIRPRPIAGKNPSDLLNGLLFLNAFRAPNSIQILPNHGPAISDALLIDNADGFNAEQELALATDLARIQDETVIQLEMPAQLSAIELERITTSAALLRGEIVTRQWSTGTLVVDQNTLDQLKQTEQEFALAVVTSLSIQINDSEIALGYQQVNYTSMILDGAVTPIETDDGIQIATKAGANGQVSFRLSSAENPTVSDIADL